MVFMKCSLIRHTAHSPRGEYDPRRNFALRKARGHNLQPRETAGRGIGRRFNSRDSERGPRGSIDAIASVFQRLRCGIVLATRIAYAGRRQMQRGPEIRNRIIRPIA